MALYYLLASHRSVAPCEWQSGDNCVLPLEPMVGIAAAQFSPPFFRASAWYWCTQVVVMRQVLTIH